MESLVLGLSIFFIVLTIISKYRHPLEKRLYNRFRIERDWWVPTLVVSILLFTPFLTTQTVISVFLNKIDIIVLIFSFGILAEGLRASGFFAHFAYKITNKCNGNQSVLLLGLFLFTSLSTLVTSNDIVILIITPLIITISIQAGIKNIKFLLLSQFIAANTLSMALLIGSPTNIIIAETLQLDFIEYSKIMLFPTIISFLSTLIFLKLLSETSILPFLPSHKEETYTLPTENPEPIFTTQMRDWVLIFTLFLSLVAIITFLNMSLLYCAVPSIIISFFYWAFADSHTTPVQEPLKNLPYGIFFFGMGAFILANAFSQTPILSTQVIPTINNVLNGNNYLIPFVGIFGSGAVVNLFNDLPAAALIAESYAQFAFPTNDVQLVATQAILVGLNIGTYITQIGALAGLIWFDQMRTHADETIITPTSRDLLKYGTLHFIFVGTITAISLCIELVIL